MNQLGDVCAGGHTFCTPCLQRLRAYVESRGEHTYHSTCAICKRDLDFTNVPAGVPAAHIDVEHKEPGFYGATYAEYSDEVEIEGNEDYDYSEPEFEDNDSSSEDNDPQIEDDDVEHNSISHFWPQSNDVEHNDPQFEDNKVEDGQNTPEERWLEHHRDGRLKDLTEILNNTESMYDLNMYNLYEVFAMFREEQAFEDYAISNLKGITPFGVEVNARTRLRELINNQYQAEIDAKFQKIQSALDTIQGSSTVDDQHMEAARTLANEVFLVKNDFEYDNMIYCLGEPDRYIEWAYKETYPQQLQNAIEQLVLERMIEQFWNR